MKWRLFTDFIKNTSILKNYANELLNSKFNNIVEKIERELKCIQNKNLCYNIKQKNLQEKRKKLSEENAYLKAEVKSYEKVIQVITNKKANGKKSGKAMPRKSEMFEFKNRTLQTNSSTLTPMKNLYELLIDFLIMIEENEDDILLRKQLKLKIQTKEKLLQNNI